MNLGFLGNAFTSQGKQESFGNEPKLSLLSLFTKWANSGGDKFEKPTTINKELKRHAQTSGNVDEKVSGETPLRFRPYVCKVPWHTGVRAFVSQWFPRYGHYCGPNWSSGKDGGSLVWDRRPIDWLDYCCYCHDIGYDTHDQAKLLKADLAFLECLEKQHVMSTKGDPHIAHLYKTMCINGMPCNCIECLCLGERRGGRERVIYDEFFPSLSPPNSQTKSWSSIV